MTGAEFEVDFIARCTPMTVTATLSGDAHSSAMLWARDTTHHATAAYCGCGDVKVLRADRDLYAQCAAHGIQPLGKARRIRQNWVFAGA